MSIVIRLFLINILIITLPSVASSNELTKEDQLDIIFSEKNLFHDPELRKIVFFASEITKTAKQYRDNPASLPVWQPTDTGQSTHYYETVRYRKITSPTSAPVLERKKNEILLQLDGSKISQSVALKTLSRAADAMRLNKLSAALKTGSEVVDAVYSGNAPKYSNTATNGIGELITSLKDLDDEAYKMIVEQIEERKGFDIEDDLSNHTSVVAFNDAVEDREAQHQLELAVGDLKKGVDQLLAIEDDARIQAERKSLRNTVQSSFETAAMLASLSGDPNLGRKISTAGQIADKILVISNSGGPDLGKLGVLAATQNYVAIASLTVELLSDSGGGFEASVMAQLQQIMEMIQELRKTIEREFFIVNKKLDDIDLKLSQIIAEIRQSGQANADLIRETKKAISIVEAAINNAQIIEQKEKVSEVKRNCIADTQGFDDEDNDTIVQFKSLCITPLIKASSEFITSEAQNLRLREPKELRDYVLNFGEKNILPSVFSSLMIRNYGLHPGISEVTAEQLVDPNSWLDNSGLFLDLLETYPSKHYLFLEQDFQDIIISGERYADVQENLLAISKTQLRWNVINNLLEGYRTDLLNELQRIFTSAESYTGTAGTPKLGLINIQGFHAGMDLNQKNKDAKWYPHGKELKWCKNTGQQYRIRELGTLELQRTGVVYRAGILVDTYEAKEVIASSQFKTRYLRENQRFNSHHTRFRFLRLPDNFEKYLPERIRWLLDLEHSSISICLAFIEFHKMKGVLSRYLGITSSITNQYDNSYEGSVHIHVYHKDRLLSDGVFPVKGSHSGYCSFMHSVGLGGPEKTPCPRIPDRPVVATIFESPTQTANIFAQGLQNKELFRAEFAKKYEDSWDKQAVEHFSVRNSLYINNARKAASKAELLYLAVRIGLNDDVNESKNDILNYFFAEEGLISPLQALRLMIYQNKTPAQIEKLLTSRIEQISEKFQTFENVARDKNLTVYNSNDEIRSQLERIVFFKKNQFFPAKPNAE